MQRPQTKRAVVAVIRAIQIDRSHGFLTVGTNKNTHDKIIAKFDLTGKISYTKDSSLIL
jgi:hypothetical protein